jgi:hypothetical protein
MWIEKVKEAKKRLDLSYREISIATEGKLSERDVLRLINGDYKKPFVDDVITLGAALKLSPAQLFEDSSIVVESVATAQESSALAEENAKLSDQVVALKKECDYLRELLKTKNELLDVYRNLAMPSKE